MIKNVFSSIASSFRALLRFWSASIVFLSLYVSLLSVLYLFFATREATIAQLFLTMLLALAVPLLFFVLQTMAVRYVGTQGQLKTLLVHAFRDFWKLLVISLPVILMTGVMAYLLVLISSVPDEAAAVAAPLTPTRVASAKSVELLQWTAVAVASTQYLLIGLVLPLVLMHLWIVAAREGLKAAFKGFGRTVFRALAPGSVITYAIGFVFFAVVPYFLLFIKTEASSTWLDITMFSFRLLLAVLLSLIGWVVTLGALTLMSTADRATERTAETIEGTENVPAGS